MRERTIENLFILIFCSFLFLVSAVSGANAQESETARLGQMEYLVVSAGLDSTLGYQWQLGPGPGHRSLTWPHGVLSLPDSLSVESLGESDLVVNCLRPLSGLGHSGQLRFEKGIFEISEPVIISNGSVHLYVTAGELVFQERQIRYSQPGEEKKDPRAGYIFLGGMVLMVMVLLRRAALKTKKRTV